jgi:septum formation protein
MVRLDSRSRKECRIAMQPLLLASASPRRRELLIAAGIAFEVISVSVSELDASTAPHLNAAQLAEANAKLKAHDAAQPARWVLGADTVVALKGRIFGKPATLDEARDFLRALRGATHEVVTGCALVGPDGAATIFHETTRVTFRALSGETIDRYLAEVPVLDKAGAYGLQERGEIIIERVEGSRANVIGLPVERLLPLLRERGLA